MAKAIYRAALTGDYDHVGLIVRFGHGKVDDFASALVFVSVIIFGRSDPSLTHRVRLFSSDRWEFSRRSKTAV